MVAKMTWFSFSPAFSVSFLFFSFRFLFIFFHFISFHFILFHFIFSSSSLLFSFPFFSFLFFSFLFFTFLSFLSFLSFFLSFFFGGEGGGGQNSSPMDVLLKHSLRCLMFNDLNLHPTRFISFLMSLRTSVKNVRAYFVRLKKKVKLNMTKNNSGFHCKLFIFLDFFKSTGDFMLVFSIQVRPRCFFPKPGASIS